MGDLVQISFDDYEQPETIKFGCVTLGSFDTLPLEWLVLGFQDTRAVASMTNDVRGNNDHVRISVYRFPEKLNKFERTFDEEVEFDKFSKFKKPCKIDGLAHDHRMLALEQIPSDWQHEAYAPAKNRILHVYRSSDFAITVRFLLRQGKLLEYQPFLDIARLLSLQLDQWVIDKPALILKPRTDVVDLCLSDELLAEIRDGTQRAYGHLRLAPGQITGESLITAINDFVDLQINTGVKKNRAIDLAIDLGTLWGQVLCDEAGWEWRSLVIGNKPAVYCVAKPDRSHCISPTHFLLRMLQLKGPDAENTTLLTYNLLKDSTQLDAPPGAYRWIG